MTDNFSPDLCSTDGIGGYSYVIPYVLPDKAISHFRGHFGH